ncbi:MAG: hypothetical protein AB1779_05385 [Candidatus Thermoplasmatota archaeon]
MEDNGLTSIYYKQKMSDYRLHQMEWLLLATFCIVFATFFFYLLYGIPPTKFDCLMPLLFLLGFIGGYGIYRLFNDKPMMITSEGIHFSSQINKPVLLTDIVAIGWLKGIKGGDPHQFLLIVVQSGVLYIIGKLNSRHVSQTVADIDDLAKALSSATKKRILTADINWLNHKWRDENILKLKEESTKPPPE